MDVANVCTDGKCLENWKAPVLMDQKKKISEQMCFNSSGWICWLLAQNMVLMRPRAWIEWPYSSASVAQLNRSGCSPNTSPPFYISHISMGGHKWEGQRMWMKSGKPFPTAWKGMPSTGCVHWGPGSHFNTQWRSHFNNNRSDPKTLIGRWEEKRKKPSPTQ